MAPAPYARLLIGSEPQPGHARFDGLPPVTGRAPRAWHRAFLLHQANLPASPGASSSEVPATDLRSNADPAQARLRSAVGGYRSGVTDTKVGDPPSSPAQSRANTEPARLALTRLMTTASQRGLKLSLAESLTAGLATYLLIDQPGAGEVVRGSLVTYETETKRTLLGVDGPVVSARCARQMARRVTVMFNADLGLSFTGVAGPSRLEGQPVGTVFVGVSDGSDSAVAELFVPGEPNEVRVRSICAAAELAEQFIVEHQGDRRAARQDSAAG